MLSQRSYCLVTSLDFQAFLFYFFAEHCVNVMFRCTLCQCSVSLPDIVSIFCFFGHCGNVLFLCCILCQYSVSLLHIVSIFCFLATYCANILFSCYTLCQYSVSLLHIVSMFCFAVHCVNVLFSLVLGSAYTLYLFISI